MQRHINFHHQNLSSTERHELIKLLESCESVPKMLIAAGNFLAKGDIFDGQLPQEVIERLKKEDVKLQITLRMIAVSKIRRALQLAEQQAEIDELQRKEIEVIKQETNPDKKPGLWSIQNSNASLQTAIASELRLVADLARMNNISLATVVEELVKTIAPLASGSTQTGTGALVPKSLDSREKIRAAVAGFLVVEKDSTNGNGLGADDKSARRAGERSPEEDSSGN